MYEFVSGPLFWIAAAVFLVGSVWKIWSTLVLAKQDKVVYP